MILRKKAKKIRKKTKRIRNIIKYYLRIDKYGLLKNSKINLNISKNITLNPI